LTTALPCLGLEGGEPLAEFVEQGADLAGHSVDDLVIRNPVTFAPSDDALKAAGTMLAKQIRRLPVIEDGRLVGTVARSDIARAVLGN
jgi:CBS domain-containing protein